MRGSAGTLSRSSAYGAGTLDKLSTVIIRASDLYICRVRDNLIHFVRTMCAIIGFHLGPISQICSYVGPGILYLSSLRVGSFCIRDHV